MHLDLSHEECVALAEIIHVAIKSSGIDGPENYRITKNGILFADRINSLLMNQEQSVSSSNEKKDQLIKEIKDINEPIN